MGMRFLLGIHGRRIFLVNIIGAAQSTFFLLVGGMLGGRTWLFLMATWSMVLFGIGRCLCLLFGIGGIIAIVGRLRNFKICLLTIGRLFTGRMKRESIRVSPARHLFALFQPSGSGSAVFCCGIVSILLMDWGGFAGLRNGKGKKETSLVPVICGSWGFCSFRSYFAFVFLEAKFSLFNGEGREPEKQGKRKDECSFSQEEKADGRSTISRSKREAGRLCLPNSLFGNADYLNALQASVKRDFL